jgi:protoporphyrin/coproporphyrin ferrochelatase
MVSFFSSASYRHGATGGVGVLLANLGTPEAPTPAALRRYLRQFLSDRRVVEVSRPVWWVILNLFVLPFRPRRSARLYASIWTDEGSPLLVTSRRQRELLEESLGRAAGEPISVALGMRYGTPSLPSALRELRDRGCTRVLVLPLYPQYSSATTGSTFDAVFTELQGWRWVPELRTVASYHDHPGYVAAVAATIRERWEREERPERLLFSFHGIPKRTFLAGDPYFCHCQKTARLVAERLELPAGGYTVAFQSRFGREEWLQPYTDATLEGWGRAGVGSVDVVCPGFAADCLETIEEIAELNRTVFQGSGGGRYGYVPALNDREDHIAALRDLVIGHLAGWLPGRVGEVSAAASRARALAAGAPQ